MEHWEAYLGETCRGSSVTKGMKLRCEGQKADPWLWTVWVQQVRRVLRAQSIERFL